jgi:hypothetical protein
MKPRWISLAAAAVLASVSSSVGTAQEFIPTKPPIATNLPGFPSPDSASHPIPFDSQTPTLHDLFPGQVPAPEAPAKQEMQDNFVPYMLGDFASPVANMFSDVKIAEGESPRPTDRVFVKFNYYNNLAPDTWTDPTQPIHNVDLYRYSVGMEKTFFDEKISLGLRIPFYTIDADGKDFTVVPPANDQVITAQIKQRLQTQLEGVLGNFPLVSQIVNQLVTPSAGTSPAPVIVTNAPGLHTTQFGNISAVLKAVAWEDRDTGSLLSAGAVISFPTASSKLINPGQSTLLYTQPFTGFIFNQWNLFMQGFTSVTIPIASAESIVLFNDVGVGYFLYRSDPHSSLLTAVVPTMEVHVTTPLRQADPNVLTEGIYDTLKLHNSVDFTLGTTLEFTKRATLGVGVSVPVTGDRPYDVEALAQFNYRF